MKRTLPPMTTRCLIVLAALLLLLPTGCGSGKKKTAQKDYGEPTWLKVDKAQLAPLSEDATSLEGGTITVYDPEGWERQPRGAAKPPKGFKSVIVFKKDGVTIMMTKSEKAKDMPDLDEENIEDFAKNAQQLFKSKVQMVKLGSLTGVMFAKRVADAQRMSKFFDRRIVATAIHGQLFTFELIADKGKIDKETLGALYGMISKTEFDGMEPVEAVSDEGGEGETVAATEPKAEAAPMEIGLAEPAKEESAAVAEAKPEPKEEPKVETAAAETPKVEEPKVEDKPAVEVAAAKSADKPKTEPKKPAAKKAAPKKKADTKAILNELDALLN